MTDKQTDISIVVPTYNERQNISLLYRGICRSLADFRDWELVFVDDNSPDGTADLIQQISQRDPRVRLVSRPSKLGLGSAIVEGFKAAQGEKLVMMDADLSHRPQDLSRLLEPLASNDIVIGSRYIPGGQVLDWPLRRKLASKLASVVGRWFLSSQVRDVASGFAAFRRESIQPILPSLRPQGFKLLMEILYRCPTARVAEVPIVFADRKFGRSKLNGCEVLSFARLCLNFRFGG